MAVPTMIAVAEGGGRSAILKIWNLGLVGKVVVVADVVMRLMLGFGRRDEAVGSVFFDRGVPARLRLKARLEHFGWCDTSREYYIPEIRSLSLLFITSHLSKTEVTHT